MSKRRNKAKGERMKKEREYKAAGQNNKKEH